MEGEGGGKGCRRVLNCVLLKPNLRINVPQNYLCKTKTRASKAPEPAH